MGGICKFPCNEGRCGADGHIAVSRREGKNCRQCGENFQKNEGESGQSKGLDRRQYLWVQRQYKVSKALGGRKPQRENYDRRECGNRDGKTNATCIILE